MNARTAILAALLAITGTAAAQGFNHAPRGPLGWHGSGNSGVQVHYHTQEAALPWLGVWTRAPVDGTPGNPPGWVYVKVLINCEDWYALPFGIAMAPGHPLELVGDVTGRDPVPQPATPGSPLGPMVLALCGQHGYVPPDRRPLRPFPSGTVTR